MINSSFREVALSKDLKKEINGINTRCFEAQLTSSIEDKITVFCCEFNSLTEMVENWEMINNFIAADYQSNLTSDFSRWNIYLLLWCKESLTKSVKYKIENDRAFLRKIVFDDSKLLDTDEELVRFIDTVVLGADLVNCKQLKSKQENSYELSSATLSLMNFVNKDYDELTVGNVNLNSKVEGWSLEKVWLEIGLKDN